jgi:glycosyltransferase involved in cell wall biosynthesis
MSERSESRGLTLVVPAYNEAETLPQTMPRLVAHAASIESPLQVIIVDNGSTDATREVMTRIAGGDPRIVGLHTSVRGVGSAMRTAIPHIRYDRVVTVDADLTTDLRFIEEAVELLDHGWDIVCGSKVLGAQQRHPLRVAVTGLLGWLGHHGLGVPQDVSPGAKGYRRAVLRAYGGEIGAGSGYLLNILVAAQHSGVRVTSIPVRCNDRRPSRYNLAAEGGYRFGHVLWLMVRRLMRRIRGSA